MQDVHEGSDILNQRGIEAEKIRLARDDGQSVLLWVDQLCKDGDLLAFKSSADAVPKDSGLDEDAFVLAMQTPYQREVFEKYGHAFAGLDADMLAMSIWTKTNTNTTNKDLIVQSSR